MLGGGFKPFQDGVVTVNIVTPPVLNQANAFPANPNTMTIKEKRNGIMVTRFYLTSLSGTAGRVHTDFIETAYGGSNFRPPLP